VIRAVQAKAPFTDESGRAIDRAPAPAPLPGNSADSSLFMTDRRGDNDNLAYQSLYKLDVPRYASVGGAISD